MPAKKKSRIYSSNSNSRSSSRRRLLKGGILAGAALPFAPARWSAPVAESVLLPAHAATSVACPPPPGTLHLTAPCGTNNVTSHPYGVAPPPPGCDNIVVTARPPQSTADPGACFSIKIAASPLRTAVSVIDSAGALRSDIAATVPACINPTSFGWSPSSLSSYPITCGTHTYEVTVQLTNGSLDVAFTVAMIS